MKTSTIANIEHLILFDGVREYTTPNGTKTYKVASVVFSEPVNDVKAVTLTAKEMDNFCRIAKIRVAGRKGWEAFSDLIMANIDGTGARAKVSVEEHEAGTEYVKADKTVGTYLKSYTDVRIELIVFDKLVSKAFAEFAVATVNRLKGLSMSDADGSVGDAGDAGLGK